MQLQTCKYLKYLFHNIRKDKQRMIGLIWNKTFSPYISAWRKDLILKIEKQVNLQSNSMLVGAVLMEWYKFFDSIPRNLTIAKMKAYEIQNEKLRLIFCMKKKYMYSILSQIASGIPWESTLGLFSLRYLVPISFSLFK